MFSEKLVKTSPHLHVNPIVKAYMISEAFLWSAWNFITPIFAVFVVNNVSGGNIETASIGFSVYLISRVVFELITSGFLRKKSDRKLLLTTLFGMTFLSVSYFGFAFSDTVFEIFIFYVFAGLGFGVAAPAKNTLFSMHLDKDQEATEWGVTDAVAFICMALASALGGFIVTEHGFQSLFILAGIVNLLGMIPYALYIKFHLRKTLQVTNK